MQSVVFAHAVLFAREPTLAALGRARANANERGEPVSQSCPTEGPVLGWSLVCLLLEAADIAVCFYVVWAERSANRYWRGRGELDARPRRRTCSSASTCSSLPPAPRPPSQSLFSSVNLLQPRAHAHMRTWRLVLIFALLADYVLLTSACISVQVTVGNGRQR